MARSPFLHVDKIKNATVMQRLDSHYTRKCKNEEHIDYSLTPKNIYFVGNENDNFLSEYRKTVASLSHYDTHEVAKNAVWAFDILAKYPGDKSEIDPGDEKTNEKIRAWAEQTKHFIFSKFGKDNVLNMVLHMDEPDSVPHIHAVSFPIDKEKQKLIASSYIDGPSDLRRLQTEYADNLKNLGFDRGIVGSPARSQSAKTFQKIKHQAFAEHAPKVKEGETAQQYRERIDEEWMELRASTMIKDNTIKRQGDLRETEKRKDKHIRAQNEEMNILREENFRLKTELHNKKTYDYALKHGISIYPEQERGKLQRVYELLADVAERGKEDLKKKGIDLDVEAER